MVKHPLALLPVVTIAAGRSRLAPSGFGASTQEGTPASAITSWVAQGAAWVHVVDEDAGASGSGAGLHHAVGAHLQYQGAVDDDASLTAALSTGAARVVIETADPAWAARAVAAHGDRLAVALDISQPDVLERAAQLEAAGCRRFVVSDRTERHWKHERSRLEELCAATNVPVMALGAVEHLSDLHALHELVPLGMDGIIIDDALYDGAFSYSEALAASADRFDIFFWGPPGT